MALELAEQLRLRLAAFDAVDALVEKRGGFATYAELRDFELEGRRFPLIDQSRGIWNPVEFDATLSIVSAADGPYGDHVGPDGLLRYDFEAGDPLGRTNRKLRAAMQTFTPIIVFEKPLPNVYVPVTSAFVVDEDREAGQFIVATDNAIALSVRAADEGLIDRRYVEQLVWRRVHQPVFRARVMHAYQTTCAVCRLKHGELLDAAHIIPDADTAGITAVTNGLALCKIHHAAYDQNLLGISADYRVHIDRDLLDEVDGPMLRHGLQDMHGTIIYAPRRVALQPSRESLAARFEGFGR